ncbi:MAG: O-antigen ligase family protein [Bacteroidales bacterium]|nr:O-antigen ligase family protein [Bacteroidales bacterium]
MFVDSLPALLEARFNIHLPGFVFTGLNLSYLIFFSWLSFDILRRKGFKINIAYFPLLFALYIVVNTYINNISFLKIGIYLVYFLALFCLSYEFSAKKIYFKAGIPFIFKVLYSFFFFLFVFYIFSINKGVTFSFREVRVSGFLSNANEDAGAFITLFPFALYWSYKKNIQKIYRIILIASFLFVLIFLNGTRFAIIGFVVSMFLFYYKLGGHKLAKSIGLYIAIISIPIVFFSGTFSSITNSIDIDKLIAGENINDNNLVGRIGGIWIPASLNTIDEDLFFGKGLATWFDQEVTFTANEHENLINTNRAPHNSFVYNFYQLGLLGVLIFFWLFYAGIASLNRTFKRTKNPDLLLIYSTLLASWIGFIFWNCFANAWPVISIPILVILFSVSVFINYNMDNDEVVDNSTRT